MGKRHREHPEAHADGVIRRAALRSPPELQQVWIVVGKLHVRDPVTGRMTRFLGKAGSRDEAKERAKLVLSKDQEVRYDGCWIIWRGELEPKKKARTKKQALDIPLERTLL